MQRIDLVRNRRRERERERARQREEGVGDGGGGGGGLSQAIKLNVELHSSSCLSMPLCLMLPPKQRIKGLECGVGKSQALSLPAHNICKSRRQKRERERGRHAARESACMECGYIACPMCLLARDDAIGYFVLVLHRNGEKCETKTYLILPRNK